ncbi:MAG: hypothetical protein KIS70_03785 [Xanthobacteraceae bacterium]|nr:hypothetical protein [Xanthobacteraceae bacterium]
MYPAWLMAPDRMAEISQDKMGCQVLYISHVDYGIDIRFSMWNYGEASTGLSPYVRLTAETQKAPAFWPGLFRADRASDEAA